MKFKIDLAAPLAAEITSAARQCGLRPNDYVLEVVEQWCAGRRSLKIDESIVAPMERRRSKPSASSRQDVPLPAARLAQAPDATETESVDAETVSEVIDIHPADLMELMNDITTHQMLDIRKRNDLGRDYIEIAGKLYRQTVDVKPMSENLL